VDKPRVDAVNVPARNPPKRSAGAGDAAVV